jgi:two-component system, chemotaxis family, protein-glutamate methylesterase/glutaminase
MMESRPPHLVVIGGSAGAWPVLQLILRNFPADLPAAVAVVIHRSPHAASDIARVLEGLTPLSVTEPAAEERLQAGRIYLAPANLHLTVTRDTVVPTRGAREHHTRPAIDVLFRTAAREFGPAVTAVLLSGTGADGSAGLMAVRNHGGRIIVQAPSDAAHAGMPRRAATLTTPDHLVPADDIATLLPRLIGENRATPMKDASDPAKATIEHDIAAQEQGTRNGQVSTYACPDCGGTLWQVEQGGVVQFVCHTGHRWAPHSMLVEKTEALEAALLEAVRLLREKAMLLRQVAGKAAPAGQSGARLLEQAAVDDAHASLIQSRLLEGQPSSLSNGQVEADVAQRTGVDGPGPRD